ncbi:hypothetical protein CIP107510_02131 [Corynebacterium diphtheriae]|nr:hypothetical protein CIP107510_02131 [Corynebacterium diphtheriae]CAB0663689.1 hypothetical protein FRC0016_01966 [Corynebacterium diphtheriae]CAB0813757.1 hypothetical protein FRC0213_01971 [Corynebacterium diphtheriae]
MIYSHLLHQGVPQQDIGTLNATIALARALADAHFHGHRPTRIINAGTAGSLIPQLLRNFRDRPRDQTRL